MAEEDKLPKLPTTRRSVSDRYHFLNNLLTGMGESAWRLANLPRHMVGAAMEGDQDALGQLGGELAGSLAMTMFGPSRGGGGTVRSQVLPYNIRDKAIYDDIMKAIEKDIAQAQKGLTPTGKQIVSKPWIERRESNAQEYLASLPPLLPEAERHAARVAGGYTTPALRGRHGHPPRRVDEGDPERPIFSTASPELAELYATAGKHAEQIQPLYLNTRDYLVRDAAGGDWTEIQASAFREARRKGAPGVVFHNIYDEPATHSYDSVLGRPQTVYATFDPRTRKSQFARRFDPSSPDILESAAPKSVPLYSQQNKPLPEEREAREKFKATVLRTVIDRALGELGAP